MEKTDLISGLDLERLGSTTEVSLVPRQASSRQGDGKMRRHPNSSEDDPADLVVEDMPPSPPHQIDWLA